MRRLILLFSAVFAVCVAWRPASAQKFIPKSIQFRGDPEYSNEEMMAAIGLKKGVALNFDEMKAYTQHLLDTGVFSTVAFRFDGQDLIFTLAPNNDLYPIKLENLPLTPGKDLDAKLHEQVPLYHGKVPADGGLAENVRAALQSLLSSEGLQANVIAAPEAALGAQKVNAVSYSIGAPPVQTAVARVDGVSAFYQAKVQTILGRATDVSTFPFDTAHSAGNLARVVTQFYNDEGFAAAKVQVERDGNPAMASGAIQVPFSIQVQEGRVYKVGSIQLPTGAPVTQAEMDKILSGSGIVSEGVRVRSIWALLSQRYRSKGYLDCKVTPQAAFDEAGGAVNYTVDIDPGPVYHLGFVKFDNVSDEMRTLLIHNWQMLPGDPFDESYVANFIVKAQAQDPVLRRSLAGVKTKFDATANPVTHEVNVTIRLEK